jgi:hypothetical protein
MPSDRIVSAIEALLNRAEMSPSELPTEDTIRTIITSLRKPMLEDYVYFLSKCNNVRYGTLEPAIVSRLESSRIDIRSVSRSADDMGVPQNWLAFCEDNGDYFCFLQDGQVRFWSHDGSTDEKWLDLAEWIEIVWIGKR